MASYKETINYLKNIRSIPKELKVLNDSICCLELELTEVSAPPFDSDHVISSGFSDYSKRIDDLIKMKEDLENNRREYLEILKEAQSKIKQLKNSNYRIVITEYYLLGKTMEYISSEIFEFSLQHTYRVRKKAINSLKNFL
jgi:uncharacterized protein YeeX (DUF496 family)